MIPRTIHYCWFGNGAKSDLAIKCIDSWKRVMPDFKIKEWNESNFDITACPYVKAAYETRKFAFVADYVRLYALSVEGGIYMDSDVEAIRSLNPFLDLIAFTGYQNGGGCLTGTMGSEKSGRWVSELLNEYETRSFIANDGSLNLTTNVTYTHNYMRRMGARLDGTRETVVGLVELFPEDFFCAKDAGSGKMRVTDNTYTIHHFAASWQTPRERLLRWVAGRIGRRTAMALGLITRNPLTIPGRIVRFVKDGR